MGNMIYDVWQGDISSRFKVKLGNAMKEMHVRIEKQLEGKLSKDVSSRHLRTDCFYVSSFATTNCLTDEE